MRFKQKITTLVVMLLIVLLLLFCFHQFPAVVSLYSIYFFTPYQWLRGLLLGFLPFSLGDLLYFALILWAVLIIIKWLNFLINFKKYKLHLSDSLLKTSTLLAGIYLLFFIGWGGNYAKPPLSKIWELDSRNTSVTYSPDVQPQRPATKELKVFDSFLVNRLNTYAPHFQVLHAEELNARACRYFRLHTDTRLKKFGLGVKPTLLTWLLNGIDLEGYYNPFTGEGQFDSRQPSCTLPELFTHEIAHQAGIAAEGDANLLSYAVCTASGDSSFCYSAYLNAWQLTNERLFLIDSGYAAGMEHKLNNITRAHIDSLDQRSKDTDNKTGHFFDKLFDGYLKAQSQKEGLDDYASIAITAWQLEQKRAKVQDGIIRIP